MLLKNQQAIYARLEAVTQRQEKIFSYIASYIDAKGKAGLFDDIKALYKDEKNKREKKKFFSKTYHSDRPLSIYFMSLCPKYTWQKRKYGV